MATKMTREEAINKVRQMNLPKETMEILEALAPELAESEDERIRKALIWHLKAGEDFVSNGVTKAECLAYLEKQKENPKSADSIPSDCTSDVKCEYRWHKVTDSLPDNPREVLCKDEAGNYFIGRYYVGEGWEISNYDDEDKPHHLNPPVSKWIDFPSEKQKEQKPAEWSEEDEKDMAHIIRILDDCYVYGTHDLSKTDHENLVNKLKSLRPSWKPSENELAKKHLDGYCMGREDTLREMKDFVESHFNCENAKKGTPIVYNTQSGTSTLKAEG